VISSLVYILTNSGNDEASGLAELRKMSGEDIVMGLLTYRQNSHRSMFPGGDLIG